MLEKYLFCQDQEDQDLDENGLWLIQGANVGGYVPTFGVYDGTFKDAFECASKIKEFWCFDTPSGCIKKVRMFTASADSLPKSKIDITQRDAIISALLKEIELCVEALCADPTVSRNEAIKDARAILKSKNA